MTTHITILKEGLDPLEAIEITLCGKCNAGCHSSQKNYHCPICPPMRYKPKKSLKVIQNHLVDHFTGDNLLIHAGGYRIVMCFNSCPGAEFEGHYHCPFCPVLSMSKKLQLKHLACHESTSLSEASDVKQFLQFNIENIDVIASIKGICRLKESPTSFLSPSNQESPSKWRINQDVTAAEKGDVHSVVVEYRRSGDSSDFEHICTALANGSDSAAKLSWIVGMTECASLLDRKADKLVLAFMNISFFTSKELAGAVNEFIRTLIGHHNYYAYHILKRLFQFLIPFVEDGNDSLRVSAGALSKEEEATYERILSAILTINSDVPMTQDNLVFLARKSMPYFQNHVHKHAVYTRNLLLLANYLPHLRVGVLEVIITNMITIDVHVPRAELVEEEPDEDQMGSSDEEDMFDMELEDFGGRQPADTPNNSPDDDSPLDACQTPKPMSHKTGNTLDTLMSIILQYVHDISHGAQRSSVPVHLRRIRIKGNADTECGECRPDYEGAKDFDPKRMGGCECGGNKHDVDSIKQLYNDLKVIFSNVILRTYASSHVQFLLFYVMSLRPGLLPFFADFLINKRFKDPNSSPCIRKNAMAYIGSLLARGKHVSILDVHACLESIRDWCNEYLDTQERIPERNYEDIMLHEPFYCACQTLFYVFTFRYKQYTDSKKTLTLVRSLNLDRFIHSKLNPLHICSQAVVSNFAAVAQHFQIAYCHTIMENNKRLGIPSANLDYYIEPVMVLESFFPFDPYLLNRSKLYIQNHYREFEGLPEDMVISDGMEIENETPKTIVSPESYDAMYGISPGFVRFKRFTEESVYN